MATATKHAYRIEFCQGYGRTDHLAQEVADRCAGTYRTLAAARLALRNAKAAHRVANGRATGYDQGRHDIVRDDGKRFAWE